MKSLLVAPVFLLLLTPAFAQSSCVVVDPGFIVCNGQLTSRYDPAPTTPSQASSDSSPHKIKRSMSARDSFKYQSPCPANGKARGRCPGYIIDHIVPLACGGPDDPSNMQWQTTADAKAKDKWERKGCQK